MSNSKSPLASKIGQARSSSLAEKMQKGEACWSDYAAFEEWQARAPEICGLRKERRALETEMIDELEALEGVLLTLSLSYDGPDARQVFDDEVRFKLVIAASVLSRHVRQHHSTVCDLTEKSSL